MISKTFLSTLAFSFVLIGCAQQSSDENLIKSPDFLTNQDAINYADSVLVTLNTE